MKQSVIVFCAHSDDQIVGPGGTLAKYAKEGIDVYTVIFSYGESSHPHLKPEVIKEIRIKESHGANQVIGGKEVIFYGLREGKYPDEIKTYKIQAKMIKLIKKLKPVKIFTHSVDDPHPDHRAVYHAVKDAVDMIDPKPELYSFDVWNLWNIRKRHSPRLYVDITSTFKLKLKALKCFPSQKVQMQWPLTWSVYLRALIHGLHCKGTFAERFYKIR